MKHKLPAIACLVLGVARCALSQEGLYGFPFIVPADPRSFAMGESFSALPANPSALLYNPAGLAGLSGIRVSYSQRSLAGEYHGTLRSFNAVVGTPAGVFAAQYNRDYYGILPMIVTDNGPLPVEAYDFDIGIGYALGLGRGFSIGGAAKYYDSRGLTPGPSTGYSLSTTSMPARLFDIGLTYTLRRFHSQVTLEDSLTLGMSYQNIGTGGSRTYPGVYIPELDMQVGMPQFFRAGLSYTLRVVPRATGDVSPFEAVFSGEYRSSQTTGGKDGAGLGMEFTIDEIVSLRAGELIVSGASDGHIRYGGGVRLPFRSLGFDIALQGAVIPWNSLYAFSIDVQFPVCPWN